MADPAICLMAVGAGADGSRLLISAIALSAHSPLEAGPAMSTAALGQFISSRSKDVDQNSPGPQSALRHLGRHRRRVFLVFPDPQSWPGAARDRRKLQRHV